jgi:DMSO/TMAO reductase YedYZ molybdopterin-dependent catalytic subunit
MRGGYIGRPLTRRLLLGQAGVAGLAFGTVPAWAQATIDLALPGGPDTRPITTAFPEKAAMILQRSRPPLLETPFEVFDKDVFTPNNEFFVRWHWAVIPTKVDVAAFKLAVRGHVNQALSLSMADLLAMPRVELVAVNQCSGNSRGRRLSRAAASRCIRSASISRTAGGCFPARDPMQSTTTASPVTPQAWC